MVEHRFQRGSARMFANVWLERLSHVHPATPAVVFLPLTAACVYAAAAVYGQPWWPMLWQFGAGWLCWTLIEYWLHRLLFHLPAKGPVSERIYFYLHGVHHDWPWDLSRLVIPPLFSVLLAAGFYGLFRALLGADMMYASFGGFLLGYVVYDSTHWYTHAGKSKNRALKWLREQHMRHHFQDPTTRFGVSCPFWDYVFRTPGAPAPLTRA